MKSKPPDRYQLAIVILAIATAAIGFGLFGGGVQLGELVEAPGLARQMQRLKLALTAFAALFYFLVLVTVSRMLSSDEISGISGKELTNGPMTWLYMEMISLAGLHIFGVIEELTVN